jgi:hypothetical protein
MARDVISTERAGVGVSDFVGHGHSADCCRGNIRKQCSTTARAANVARSVAPAADAAFVLVTASDASRMVTRVVAVIETGKSGFIVALRK